MSSMTSGNTPQIKLGIQTLLLPGSSLEDKFSNAGLFGFDAVEVCVGPDFDLAQKFDEVLAASKNSGVPIAAICTHPIHDPMEGEDEERNKRVDGLVELINMADALGAQGVVSVPVRSRALLETASRDEALQIVSAKLVDVLKRIAGRLQNGNAALFLEPLNRYETWFLNSVKQATDLAIQVDHPRVKALADIFHMNIEEASFSEPVLSAGSMLGHVHVADNNRLEVGAGCLDLTDFFRALKQISFTGYISTECFSATGPKVSGPPEVVLPKSVQYMRSIWDSLDS